ncbi:JAB domain-containing protein [Candidatus Microgenomates bacterium]|nr:MAG: JAB domain-containing protein [Candidatus Microgenomates bacterium]
MGKIKDLPRVDRPREKLEKYGPEKLTSSELLAILLRTGYKGISALELAKKILKKFDNENLTRATFKELKDTFGLGSVKTCEVIACFELGRRFLKDKQSILIISPRDVWVQLKDIRDNKKEHFVIFFLDSRNQEITREIISVGSLNENLVHPREVFEPAIRYLAAQVVISHNHPSGDPEPSEGDSIMTRKLIDAGKLLGIELIDHVIVAQKNYYSYREHNLL